MHQLWANVTARNSIRLERIQVGAHFMSSGGKSRKHKSSPR